MSSILDFSGFECVVSDCPLFLGNTIWSGMFVILDYYPTILTVIMYTFSIYYYELYTFLVSVILTFDFFLNWGLQYAIAMPARYPGCGARYEMPSYSSQHACVFLTIVFTFFSIWNKIVPPHRLVLLNVVTVSVVTARVFVGINTSLELIIGALIGVSEGIIFQLIIYYLIYPHFNSILKWRFMRILGFEDNICNVEKMKENEKQTEHEIVRKCADAMYDLYMGNHDNPLPKEVFINDVENKIKESSKTGKRRKFKPEYIL